jgi:hypothetical protein
MYFANANGATENYKLNPDRPEPIWTVFTLPRLFTSASQD